MPFIPDPDDEKLVTRYREAAEQDVRERRDHTATAERLDTLIEEVAREVATNRMPFSDLVTYLYAEKLLFEAPEFAAELGTQGVEP